MISRVSRFMTTFVSKYLPDPLIFAVLLTFVTFICAWGLTDSTPVDLVNMWGNGFWNLLGFGMQMALIVVTGNALATSPQIRKFLSTIASIAKTPAQGVVLVTFMGSIACIINWGFGLVVVRCLQKKSRGE